MIKDHYQISCDFSKIVEETFEMSSPEQSLNSVSESFVVITTTLKKNGCYGVSYNGKDIEIPKNWGIFSSLKSGDFKKLKEVDTSLNDVLVTYFELSAEIFLGMNTEGLFLIFIKNNIESKVA